MMGIYEFMALDFNEQAQATWDGTFLASRSDKDGSISLYDLGGFYVEVFYRSADNSIEKFRPFRSTELLKVYINFDLSKLR